MTDYTKLDKIKLTQKILKDKRNKFSYQEECLWLNEDDGFDYETHICVWGKKDTWLWIVEEKQENGHLAYYFRIAPGDAKVRIKTCGDFQRLLDIFRIGRDLIID